MRRDFGDHVVGVRNIGGEKGHTGLGLVDLCGELFDLRLLVVDGGVGFLLLEVTPGLVLVLFLLLVRELEDHFLDHVDDLVEGALVVGFDRLRQLLQNLGVHLLGLVSEQLDGLSGLGVRGPQLQEGHRRGRGHRIRRGLGAHATDLRQNLDCGLEGLLLLGPGVGALGPLRFLDAARGLRVGERSGVSVDVVRCALEESLGVVELALSVGLLRGFVRFGGLLGLGEVVVREQGKAVGVERARLALRRSNELVLEFHLEFLQQLDDAVGLEGVLLDVVVFVARGLQRLRLREGLQRGPLRRRGRGADEGGDGGDVALGLLQQLNVALRGSQGGQGVGDALDGVLQGLLLLHVEGRAVSSLAHHAALGDVQVLEILGERVDFLAEDLDILLVRLQGAGQLVQRGLARGDGRAEGLEGGLAPVREPGVRHLLLFGLRFGLRSKVLQQADDLFDRVLAGLQGLGRHSQQAEPQQKPRHAPENSKPLC
mmetsp:Transcript_98142/g.248990  ORF Transcript_98142/g.248990 Transcript_98142/m.248990 type:complete len:484 (+) Transcript_98142:809-2260(+)